MPETRCDACGRAMYGYCPRHSGWRKRRRRFLTRNQRWFFNSLFVLCGIGLLASILDLIGAV